MGNATEHNELTLKDGRSVVRWEQGADDMGMPTVGRVTAVNGFTGQINDISHLAEDVRKMLFMREIASGALQRGEEAVNHIKGYSPALLKYGADEPYVKVQHAMEAMGVKLRSESDLLQHEIEHRANDAINGRERQQFAASERVEGHGLHIGSGHRAQNSR